MPGMKGEFVPEPFLAQSNYHHEALGSSHRNQPVTSENLHRPMHEFMSDDALRLYVEDEIRRIRVEYAKLGNEESTNTSGAKRIDLLLLLRDSFLLPNLHYLKAIARLPKGIDIDALEVELAIPNEAK